MKPRVYVDTSVIGGCLDKEFSEWSRRLFEEFRLGLKVAVVSDITRRELEAAPADVVRSLTELPDSAVENVLLTDEAERVAAEYLARGAAGDATVVDAQHIAIATVEGVDVLVSWNFRHIVNVGRIRAFNAVNQELGYPELEIRTPRETLNEEDL